MSNETCRCPCCQQGIAAPHEYHLERRQMPPLGVWRSICEDAPATVAQGKKYLMLSEESCVRLGTALENAAGAGGRDGS